MTTPLTLSGPVGYKNGATQQSGPFVGYDNGNCVLRYSFKTPKNKYVTALEFSTTLRRYLGTYGVTRSIRLKVTKSSTSHVNAGEATTDYDASYAYSVAAADTPCKISVTGLRLGPDTTYYIYLYPGFADLCMLFCYNNSGVDLASLTCELTSAGLAYIDNGTSWEAYEVYIDNGTSWEQYIPYIDTGTGWDMCG